MARGLGSDNSFSAGSMRLKVTGSTFEASKLCTSSDTSPGSRTVTWVRLPGCVDENFGEEIIVDRVLNEINDVLREKDKVEIETCGNQNCERQFPGTKIAPPNTMTGLGPQLKHWGKSRSKECFANSAFSNRYAHSHVARVAPAQRQHSAHN